MKLLELCLSPNFGGLEIHFKDFCVWLDQNSHVDLNVVAADHSPIQQSLKSHNISPFTIRCRVTPFPLFAAIMLSRLIVNNNIDVVHLHWKHDLALVAITRKICRKHFLVVHTRHMDLPGSKKDIYHTYIYKEIDKLIVITDYLKDQAMRNLPLDHNKICRVYYGCNPPTSITSDEIQALKKQFHIDSTFLIGIMGRIEPYKGQHVFIQAIKNLHNEGIDVHGVIAGHAMSTDYLQEVKDLITDRSLDTCITILPFQQDPTKILQCLDALVLATVKETFGIILVEGMLAGIPVIGSNAGGVPEIIDHNQTGLLFESEDIDSLTGAIRTLYLNRELKDRIAAAGQKKAQHVFDKKNQFKKILNELMIEHDTQ